MGTEDCKLVVTCKMQNRNATDKLYPQCSKLALFANTITEICGRITMLIYYIVIICISILHDNQLAILCSTSSESRPVCVYNIYTHRP